MKLVRSIAGYILCDDKTEQDRQCTYNVTLRRVRATTVLVEKQ